MESLAQNLCTGPITFLSSFILLVLALIVGAGAGAASACKLGEADIGKELCVMMGSSFGPIAAVPGILLGLLVLKFM